MNHNLIYYILKDISKISLNGRMVSYMYQDIIDGTKFNYKKELYIRESLKEFGRFKLQIDNRNECNIIKLVENNRIYSLDLCCTKVIDISNLGKVHTSYFIFI